jgi:hypothetical protein
MHERAAPRWPFACRAAMLWSSWVLAGAVGWSVFWGANGWAMLTFPGWDGPGVYFQIIVLFSGVAIGVPQGLVLYRWHPRHTARLLLWIPVTAVGAIAGWSFGVVAFITTVAFASHAAVIVGAASLGVALGVMQAGTLAWALRLPARRASVWIAVSAVGWVLFIAIVFPFIFPTAVPWAFSTVSPVERRVREVATFAGGGAAYGAITGLALIWLLQSMSRSAAVSGHSSRAAPWKRP